MSCNLCPLEPRQLPLVPSPSPLCTEEGADKYSIVQVTGIPCCSGLTECVEDRPAAYPHPNWEKLGVCRAGCSSPPPPPPPLPCTPEGDDKFGLPPHHGISCCEGLHECIEDRPPLYPHPKWDHMVVCRAHPC